MSNEDRNTGSSFIMLRAMVGIGIICALGIALTFQGTKPRIKRNRAEALKKAILLVLPNAVSTQTFVYTENNEFEPLEAEESELPLVYVGYNEDSILTGIAMEASGMGYADVIRMIYGYDPNAEAIIGYRVLESKETPGLGDAIEKNEDFLDNFRALDVSLNEQKTELNNEVVPVKNGAKRNEWEVDCITGATISSRAIGNMLGESTAYWIPRLFNGQQQLRKPIKAKLEQ